MKIQEAADSIADTKEPVKVIKNMTEDLNFPIEEIDHFVERLQSYMVSKFQEWS